MKLSLIGDCHGKVDQLFTLLNSRCNDSDLTMQLGDMGLGVSGVVLPRLDSRFSFIRGNHDNPVFCAAHPNYAGEFGTIGVCSEKESASVFFVGGAYSIDWMHRTPGKSWWPNEELTIEQGEKAFKAYVTAKPRIVATHEAPTQVARALLLDGNFRLYKTPCTESRTAHLLQKMFEAHQPEHWFFGHYHRDWAIEDHGTKFRCLNELSVAHLTI